jgi:hypothetical protein
MRNGWVRVKKDNLCPVCNSSDWCLVQEDGTAAICSRISQGGKVVGDQGAGWLHKLTADPNWKKPKLPPKKFKPERIPNWFAMVSQCQQNLPDLSELSQELGLSMESLARLNVGFFRKCFTFPMRDGNNSFVGIRMRAKSGKFAIPGSKNALFWPLGVFAESDNILFICEGPTDTAALLDLGFDAIGRASCNTGLSYIKQMIEPYDRQVVIMGDKDEAKYKPDGTAYYPGQEGAVKLAEDLKEFVQHVRVIKPPYWKDCRAWLHAGATAAMVMTLVNNARFI